MLLKDNLSLNIKFQKTLSMERRRKSMAVIETKKIRNIALLGHGGCGKTSIAEAMIS
jgi:replication-associated recombination protein RarA